MGRKIIAGNWKMNLLPEEGLKLIRQVAEFCATQKLNEKEVIISPPMLYLTKAADAAVGKLAIAAQNCSDEQSGAYTGEVSAEMIKASGCSAVIIGHSERRQYYGDTNSFINGKLKQAFSAGLTPILCVGESLEERKTDRQKEVVANQLEECLEGFNSGNLKNLVIAYEPVWAIGTGETASPAQAQEMHAFIRSYIKDHFGEDLAADVAILYGGSVKPSNAAEIFGQDDVDGGLIGGASLKLDDFCSLIETGVKVL